MAFKLPRIQPRIPPAPSAYRSKRWLAPPMKRTALDPEGRRCAPMIKVVDTETGTVSYYPYSPVRAVYRLYGKYKPHQGAAECERRRNRQ